MKSGLIIYKDAKSNCWKCGGKRKISRYYWIPRTEMYALYSNQPTYTRNYKLCEECLIKDMEDTIQSTLDALKSAEGSRFLKPDTIDRIDKMNKAIKDLTVKQSIIPANSEEFNIHAIV